MPKTKRKTSAATKNRNKEIKMKAYMGFGLLLVALVLGNVVVAFSGSANVVVEGDYIEAGDSLGGPGEVLGASGTRFPNGVSADSTSPSAGEVRGTTLAVTGAATVGGTLNLIESYEALTATNTIAITESGKTFYLSGGHQQHTLPATTTAGQIYKFVIDGSGITASTTIVSAGSSNSINGTLIVAGAVVDCDDEDTIEFSHSGENPGDFFELRTDGTDWFIGASGSLTVDRMTCYVASS